jgi:hypothetical protein
MARRQLAIWFYAALTLLLCNVLDAAFTVAAVGSGDATEANPLMEVLLSRGALEFVVVKHVLVSLGVLLLWQRRAHRLARAGLFCSVPIYSGLVTYHVAMTLTLS